jgi:hypothetical protein
MAIAGAIKVGKKIVGKAISAAKKKKKDLEKTKVGKKVKETVSKVADSKTSKKAISAAKQTAGTAAGIGGGILAGATAGGAAAGGIAASQAGKVVRPAIDKVRSAMGKKPRFNKKGEEFGNAMKDTMTGGLVGGAAAAVGTLGLAASVAASAITPDKLYKQSKLPDGRFSTAFSDGGKNSVFSNTQLSSKQVDEVKAKLAMLEAIVTGNNPSGQRKEFLNTVVELATKYGVTNITGKNLSIQIPSANVLVQKKGQYQRPAP